MSLPEKGLLMTCPSCGNPVQQRDIFTGRHNRVCPGVKQALEDAKPGAAQKKMKAIKTQEDLALKGQTFSERWADFVLGSDFIRRWWAPAWTSTMLLSWLVGYQTPNYGFWPTMLSVPGTSLIIMFMFFNKRIRSLLRLGPVKRTSQS